MKFILLTWHGTVVCSADDDTRWYHRDILETVGFEGVFEPEGLPIRQGRGSGTDWLATAQSFKFHFRGLGVVTATRTGSDRGFHIKTGETYLSALADGDELCHDRTRPETWETFLPLQHDSLVMLRSLKSQNWIESESRRRIQKEKIFLDVDFWLRLGVRHLDLAHCCIASVRGTPNADGDDVAGRFIVPKGPNSLATLLPETSWERSADGPKEIPLADAGRVSYGNAHHPDWLFLPGSSLSETWIAEARFLQPPFFVTTADRDFFYRAAWNNRMPAIGEGTARIAVRSGEDKCVVLSRLAEGTILDEDGIYKGIGFLRLAPATPKNIKRESERFSYEEGSLDVIEHFSGVVGIPYNGNLHNYYHWLIDCILSLEVMRANVKKPFSIVLPSHLTSLSDIDYVRILAICGFGDIPLIYSRSELVRVENAVWLECRDLLEDIPSSLVRGLQARVSGQFSTSGTQKRKIFIERTHVRGIQNSAEMNSFLKDRGFISYRLEEMAFEEQVSIFANAEFVIAPHGAGLSNLLFAPKGTKVLELMPDVENRPFFWQLSSMLEHRYGQMACPVQPEEFNGWLHVDLKRLTSLYHLLDNA